MAIAGRAQVTAAAHGVLGTGLYVAGRGTALAGALGGVRHDVYELRPVVVLAIAHGVVRMGERGGAGGSIPAGRWLCLARTERTYPPGRGGPAGALDPEQAPRSNPDRRARAEPARTA